MFPQEQEDLHQIQQRAALYRDSNQSFSDWAQGEGVVSHSDETQVRVFDLCQLLICSNKYSSIDQVLNIFKAADSVANAAMWLVVHMTYANRVFLDGTVLKSRDFKENPQGHTGGSLNMVPAYVGYLAANVLGGETRSWLMGQGHCVAAIESVNVLLGNLYPEQAERYSFDDDGLSRLTSDFYSYTIDAAGRPSVPLGSHVNAHTAGGLIEGGYLGFAELQYVHMPLPGEKLVAFLSDGAFEEQRGSDWASRWWRAEDCGIVTPIMIANGRRIDQRSTMYQQGGLQWFFKHLQHNGFYPIPIDGRDPAAFVWAIFESESRLHACSAQISNGKMCYPAKLPYVIAETVKGFGFYGAGTNAAHGTPLPGNPKNNTASRGLFQEFAEKLFVPAATLLRAITLLSTHDQDRRPREKDHVLAQRSVSLSQLPSPSWIQIGHEHSPMEAVDQQFTCLVTANPELRVRVGNPDELSSNRMTRTLELLKHRVLQPENGVHEALDGSVITALNEEAVASAALANKGGMNLVVSYEAFAVKMLGVIRQEIIFARHQSEVGRPAGWLSVPVIATSHLWENGKNEQSHQDPTFGEALMSEMSDVSRVVYPADANSAMACLNACYQSHGQIWAMTIPKNTMPSIMSGQQADKLVSDGAVLLETKENADIQLVAVGAYQLGVCIEVRKLLEEAAITSRLIYMLEPGRFRIGRDQLESAAGVASQVFDELFPERYKIRVFVSHFHAEYIFGIFRPSESGNSHCLSFGYSNHGGTLDVIGMLKANNCDSDYITREIQVALKKYQTKI